MELFGEMLGYFMEYSCVCVYVCLCMCMHQYIEYRALLIDYGACLMKYGVF